jgi:hypothetical protein
MLTAKSRLFQQPAKPALTLVAGETSSGFGPGTTIRELDAPAVDHAELAVVLRVLARLMVRAHHRNGDPGANVSSETRSAELTVVPDPSVHHVDGQN